jgi:hypothetical protein
MFVPENVFVPDRMFPPENVFVVPEELMLPEMMLEPDKVFVEDRIVPPEAVRIPVTVMVLDVNPHQLTDSIVYPRRRTALVDVYAFYVCVVRVGR